MNMDKSNRIYVPTKSRMGLDRPTYGLRTLGYVLLGCAALSGLVWLHLRG